MDGLTRDDLGASGLVLAYPVPTDVLTTPLFRVPDTSNIFLVAALRFASTNAAAEEMVRSNRRWYDTATDLGGTSYPVGAIPFTDDDWTNHLGEARQRVNAAKARYDPHDVLNRRRKSQPAEQGGLTESP
jgi:hypothetical protein